MGVSNALAGFSSGFVQSGGASQTAAADGAGGRSQLAGVAAAGLILADRRVPGPAVRRPAAGDAGGDRDRGGGGLLRRRRAAALRPCAAQRGRLRRCGADRRARPRGAARACGRRGPVARIPGRAPQPPVRRRARPRSADRRLGPHRPPPRLDGHPEGMLLLRSDGPLLYPNANALKDAAPASSPRANRTRSSSTSA